jgi:hypothetical protein
MQQIETRTVMLEAARDVELRTGLVLPPGFYAGTETRIRIASRGGVSWTSPRYEIKFTADLLVDMGAEVRPNLISETIDVTKFVRSGQLIVV